MRDESYDVVIVGAGPGGLSCARALAGSGQRVLVLEKAETLGKKICAGELTAKVLPGEDFDRGRPWTEIHVGNDHTCHHLNLPRPFAWTTGRHGIESHLMKGCDADIRFGEPVQKITPDFVETRTGRYRYEKLVGADGANSIVRRHLELPREKIVGWAYHFVVDQPATEFHIYWLPRTFPAGYGYMMSRSRGQPMVGLAFEGSRFDREVAARAGASAWTFPSCATRRPRATPTTVAGSSATCSWSARPPACSIPCRPKGSTTRFAAARAWASSCVATPRARARVRR